MNVTNSAQQCLMRLNSPEFAPFVAMLRDEVEQAKDHLVSAKTLDDVQRLQGHVRALQNILAEIERARPRER